LDKYTQNVGCNPSQAYTLCVQGDSLRVAGLHKEAVSKYLRAIMLERNNADAYFGLAMAYKKLENYEKAIVNLEKTAGLKQAPDFLVNFELGVCNLLNGEPQSAVKYLIRAVQLEPEDPNAQLQLALAHELIGEQGLALMIYQKIIEFSPAFLKAHQHKAALLMSLEEYREASTVFSNILKINPKYTKAFLGIGICFDKLKRTISAMRYYKRFVEERPASRHVPFVETRLLKLKNERPEKPRLTLVTNPITA